MQEKLRCHNYTNNWTENCGANIHGYGAHVGQLPNPRGPNIPVCCSLGRGSNPWNSSLHWLFSSGPDPAMPLLSISEWIKSRGPSIAFVNQTFLLTLNLDKGTHTLEHFGRSKVVKGQAPQNILGMLWIFRTYVFICESHATMDLLDFSHRFFLPCMPQISWPLWKVLNRDKVDKHVTN